MNNKPLWQECIEAFGGYESAKKAVQESEKYPLKIFNVEAMRSHLLEYRRANNIFEDGDKVIDGLLGNQVIAYRDSYKFLGNGYVSHYVRHATDLEIKTGHRLP